jgi:hypothetical protein
VVVLAAVHPGRQHVRAGRDDGEQEQADRLHLDVAGTGEEAVCALVDHQAEQEFRGCRDRQGRVDAGDDEHAPRGFDGTARRVEERARNGPVAETPGGSRSVRPSSSATTPSATRPTRTAAAGEEGVPWRDTSVHRRRLT